MVVVTLVAILLRLIITTIGICFMFFTHANFIVRPSSVVLLLILVYINVHVCCT